VYKPTNVLSVSYGAWDYPDNYVKRQCNELMKLGLQGTTVVVSSGDSGVGDETWCADGPDGAIFYTTMMSECPYVLSVGSTQLDRPAGATNPAPPFETLNEIATTRFASGGGFSNVFGVPSWQKSAINAYFDQVDLPFSAYHHFVENNDFSSVTGGVFHHGGRAYPDIAAIGDRQVVYAGGLWYRVGGTSLSAPVVASMVTLINEARIAAGKGPVGYFTPTLYSHPEVFTDITVGSNPGCNSTGFVNAPGWDPVTGWG
jgi:tripeptidyl-peptidase-1